MRRTRSKKEVTVDEVRELLIKQIKERGYNVKTFSESELCKGLLGDKAKHLRTYLTIGGKTSSMGVFSILSKAFGTGTIETRTKVVKTNTYFMKES